MSLIVDPKLEIRLKLVAGVCVSACLVLPEINRFHAQIHNPSIAAGDVHFCSGFAAQKLQRKFPLTILRKRVDVHDADMFLSQFPRFFGRGSSQSTVSGDDLTRPQDKNICVGAHVYMYILGHASSTF